MKSPQTATRSSGLATTSRCCLSLPNQASLYVYCSESRLRPFGTYTLLTEMPPQRAVMMRVSESGSSGPAKPHTTSSIPTPGQDGDAVPPAVAVVDALVTKAGERQVRKGGVRQLGLL